MAAKRIASSSVQWTAFAERVPKNQLECFKATRVKSDMFVSRVHKYPENVPNIDFAHYKARLPNPALVDEFQKSFEALKVPYPTDKDNVLGSINQSEEQAKKQSTEYIANCRKKIGEFQEQLDGLDLLPPLEEMNFQMYAEYFPELSRNPTERPTFWPHSKRYQETDPKMIN